MADFIGRIKHAVARVIHWADAKVPRGIRSGLGVLLIVGGVFGFLPILGFWMIPAGLGMIALDVPPWRRWLKKRLGEPHRSGAEG